MAEEQDTEEVDPCPCSSVNWTVDWQIWYCCTKGESEEGRWDEGSTSNKTK